MWRYHLQDDWKGPCEAEEIIKLVQCGTLSANTYVWRDGFKDAVPYNQSELAQLPPNPPTPAPPTPEKTAELADPRQAVDDAGITWSELAKFGILKFYTKDFGRVVADSDRKDYTFVGSELKFDPRLLADGPEVTFETGIDQEQKLHARNVCCAPWLNYGIVSFYRPDAAHGFISRLCSEDSLAFRGDALPYAERRNPNPARGDYVEILDAGETINQQTGNRRLVAKRLKRVDHFVGTVVQWDRAAETGTINLEGSEKTVPVSGQHVFPKAPGKPQWFEVDDSVSFLLHADKGAICVDEEYPLRRFARFADESRMLDDLEAKVLEGEQWNYKTSGHSGHFPILHNYLRFTFQRLAEENKIMTAETNTGEKRSAFNTGLVDKRYRPIFAIFAANSKHQPGQPLWKFDRFATTGEVGSPMWIFKDFPERAVYFTDPKDVIYDTSLRLEPVTDHIIGDRSDRLPKKLLDRVPQEIRDNHSRVYSWLKDEIEKNIKNTVERIHWNYKTAVPQYYFPKRRIQLLLPLCLDVPDRVDLALAVEREGMTYVGRTILELDWAYNNARLIARPNSDWLCEEAIQNEKGYND